MIRKFILACAVVLVCAIADCGCNYGPSNEPQYPIPYPSYEI